MNSLDTLLLTRSEVARILKIEECMNAVEEAFKKQALGKVQTPKILGVHAEDGAYHIKAGLMNYFVVKSNANFPGNPKKHGLPTIQGVIAVCDIHNGRILALMDSIEISIIRTGAATGIAAKYLAKQNAKAATICGCGNQGIISLKALLKVRQLNKVYVYDIDSTKKIEFAESFSRESISITPVDDLRSATLQSDIIVTCTPSKKPFLNKEDVKPGAFIAAVGSDNEDKQELEPSLLAVSKLVTDLTDQCATIGELHHALEKGIITRSHVHAELGEIIAGKKNGRTSDDEIIIFDSTGMALQDVAAASIVYETALANKIGMKLNLAS
ncbi:MAG TPA: ornithine cyclodeaminase family protein [Cyclobacteriaceae bacterium]|jgi:ornithine cyclodeaminase/alanine dehydrogenase|nr:ornithine cyclodeaminase family protein [Cyclobacteriaceae bacterium]